MNKFLSRNKRAPTPCLPTIRLKLEKELEINYEKLGPYIKHTPQYLERLKAGEPAPYFEDPTSIAELIQEAWQKGKPAADHLVWPIRACLARHDTTQFYLPSLPFPSLSLLPLRVISLLPERTLN